MKIEKGKKHVLANPVTRCIQMFQHEVDQSMQMASAQGIRNLMLMFQEKKNKENPNTGL